MELSRFQVKEPDKSVDFFHDWVGDNVVRCVMLANNYIYYGIHGHGVQHITICRTLTELAVVQITQCLLLQVDPETAQLSDDQTVPAAVPSRP
jgi:hypothetical protein